MRDIMDLHKNIIRIGKSQTDLYAIIIICREKKMVIKYYKHQFRYPFVIIELMVLFFIQKRDFLYVLKV